MPFVAPTTTGLMTAKAASMKMSGQKMMPFLSATASAVCSYLPSVSIVNSINVVTGPGVGNIVVGKVVGVVPAAMSGLMLAKAASLGWSGKDMKKIFDAISFGVCNTLLSTVTSQGTVAGGAVGAGQGKILGLVPNVLQGLIMANLAGKKIMGEKTVQIAGVIAFGVCTHIMSAGTVVTTVVGIPIPPTPIPIPAAPGFGKLI